MSPDKATSELLGAVTQIAADAAADAVISRKHKKRGPIRDNVEAFAVAILMAVLLKYFCLEAYQIPTSSMQPTMMGSREAGVHDRLLVDKIRYEICEPKRWDITVFRYPIRKIQSYVKRCVGVPGDRLHIGGGNLYQCAAGVNEQNVLASPDKLTALRKPDILQSRLWREIYPARRILDNDSRILGTWFHGSAWTQDGEDLTANVAAGQSARLSYPNGQGAALTNLIWDGYPTAVAQAIRREGNPTMAEAVQDARFEFAFTCEQAPTSFELAMALALGQIGQKDRRFVFECKEGKARLRGLLAGKEEAASEPFEFALSAGTTKFAFEHIDDFLVIWRNGTKVKELDAGKLKVVTDLPAGCASLSLDVRGGGRLRLAGLHVAYDQHYTDDYVKPNNVIAVPEGHYFMMGDNTLASADSRAWTTIKVGMLPDGRLVDPRRHPEAKVLRGNKRARGLADPVDADENPVVVPSRGQIAFTDELGEVYALTGKVGTTYNAEKLTFVEGDHVWTPEEELTPFVPREHILGRALVTFWPTWPAGPQRIGLIR